MQRRQFLKNSLISAASVPLLRSNALQSVLAPADYQFKLLRNNVGLFAEQGGTIAWLSNKEGITVVDAEFPAQAEHLIAELKKQSDKPVKWLINTHHHADHTSGNIAFKGIAANVAAHANSLINQKRQAAEQKKEDQHLYPDTTFLDTWSTKVGNERIKAYHWGAGHTNGDSMIHFENANIVHTGDLVFNRRYPYIDRSSGASVKSWVQVLQQAQKQFNKDTLFIFGHAFDPQKITGTVADLAAMQNYMERLIDFVSSSIKAGKTKEDILAATAIPGVTDWQGDGIQRSLTAAYEELSA
jgi:cyclase